MLQYKVCRKQYACLLLARVGNFKYWSLQHLSNATFGHHKIFLLLGHFTKMCYAKFPPVIKKASPKTNCHKIQWLQFANRNIVGLLSWHSSSHFQILINPAILTMWLQLNTNCNFGLTSTSLCERRFSKQNWVNNNHRSRLKLDTWDALTQVSLCNGKHGLD